MRIARTSKEYKIQVYLTIDGYRFAAKPTGGYAFWGDGRYSKPHHPREIRAAVEKAIKAKRIAPRG